MSGESAVGAPKADATLVDLGSAPRSVRRRLLRYGRALAGVGPTSLRERLHERLERSVEETALHQARAGRDVCWVDETEREPLVTIRITTYQRPDLLVERAVKTSLQQTYRNLEVLVVGDGCDPSTGKALARVRDSRLRYINVPRAPALAAGRARWQVNGVTPANIGIALAEGSWLGPCDDDDELTPDHVEILLSRAREGRYEFVHSRTAVAAGDGRWAVLGRPRMQQGHVSHGSVLYSMGLRFMRYRPTCWMIDEPLDWNLFRRMDAIGVRVGYSDAITYRYFPSDVTASAYADMMHAELQRHASDRGRGEGPAPRGTSDADAR